MTKPVGSAVIRRCTELATRLNLGRTQIGRCDCDSTERTQRTRRAALMSPDDH
jgi:hypothetical protein